MTTKHRNDIYGDDLNAKEDGNPAIPAATVVLLRDDPDPRVLMLHKTSKIAFGGMWVFPGGRVDDEDAPGAPDDERARVAAVREAEEEASLQLDPADLVWFSHWTPPPVEIRRYSTWFFAARAPEAKITIDQGEGEPGRDIVRDFHTWRRQPDGSWKVVVDMWNSGMPAG